jgi:type IV secretion system protein VirD4
MTLSSSDSRWLKWSLIVLTLLAASVLWAYLSGGIFMVAHQHRFADATPLTLYQYWFYYRTNQSVMRWLYLSGAIAFVVTVVPAFLLFAPAKRSLFGDARWAKSSEIRKAGLLGTKGIIVGLYKRKYLMFGGSQHVILSAPTRSGKGVGIVIPNLLTWSDSVVVLDIKQENHGITSAYRRKYGQPCFLFNPAAADYRTHRYNPLAYVSDDPNFRIDDIQKIANMLFPDQQGVDPIWTATPRSLFLGIVLYLLETPGKLVTLGQVLRESLADGDGAKYFTSTIAARSLGERIQQTSSHDASVQAGRDIQTILADKGKAPEHHPRLTDMAVWLQRSPAYRDAVIKELEDIRKSQPRTPDLVALAAAVPIDAGSISIGKALSGACVRALNSYISIAADTTRAGIMTGFRSRLELWYNPLVDAATSANDFDLREVRKKRMSIYLGVTPDNLDRMAPLLNLFFQQLIDLNTRELPEQNPTLKYQCLLLADEFTAMGKIQVLSKGISYIAGYGLRMLPIIQSPAQIIDVYGKYAAETFTTNHALQIVFPPKATETETAESISKWLGYQTVKAVSESKGKAYFSKREKSESTSDQRRALLLPQEITMLGKTSEIVVVEDCPPILARKIRYYEDRTFVDRLKAVSHSLAALGRKLPTERQLKEAIRRGELAAPVALIDLDAHQARSKDAFLHVQTSATSGQGGVQVTLIERPVRPEDVLRLDKLALSDFVVDFSTVEAPIKGELDEAALRDYADQLCREAGMTV